MFVCLFLVLAFSPQVHIDDVSEVLDALADGRASGRRVNVSAGAFRYSQLAAAVGKECAPESYPPTGKSKIVSNALLRDLVPGKTEWRPPVDGVEPVSQGWPSPPEAGGSARDEYWTMMHTIFEGEWAGTTTWWGRPADDATVEFGAPLSQTPSLYKLTFRDGDHGTWDGSGLRTAPGGVRVLPLSRSTMDARGANVMFPSLDASGAFGGQWSPHFNPATPVAGLESNFFADNRTRSMTVVLYKPDTSAGAGPGSWVMDSLALAPFRCRLGCAVPPVSDEDAAKMQAPGAAAAEMAGWKGVRQVRRSRQYLTGVTPEWEPTDDTFPVDAFAADSSRVALLFRDGHMVSAPKAVTPGRAFTIVTASKSQDTAPGHPCCKVLAGAYDADHKLEAWTFTVWRPAA